MTLSPEELLAGGSLTFEIEVPPEVLRPNNGDGSEAVGGRVTLRPITVRDLQLISRAAKENDSLVATLMVQCALVDPELTIAQVAAMHVGLVQYLTEQVNHISGISATSDEISGMADAPLIKAAFILAKEFGWTPEEVGELTLGQVLLHLQMLKGRTSG